MFKFLQSQERVTIPCAKVGYPLSLVEKEMLHYPIRLILKKAIATSSRRYEK